MNRSKVVAVIALAAVAGGLAFFAVKHRRAPAPLTVSDQEALATFVKYKACEPTSCDQVVCESFSDGQTKGGPAHIARCRWADRRDPTKPRRCAYVHYTVLPTGGHGYLFLSARAPSDTCQPDQAFNDLIKSLGYTGDLP